MQGAHTSGAPAYAAISNLAEMLESCCELMLSKDLIPILVGQIYEGKEQLTEHAPRTMGVLVEHHKGCCARCAWSCLPVGIMRVVCIELPTCVCHEGGVYHEGGGFVYHEGDEGGVYHKGGVLYHGGDKGGVLYHGGDKSGVYSVR